jgi:hypothetical protein
MEANAIIGLKVDFDEISGKGKSMFMMSALGTAVYVKYDSNLETKKPERWCMNTIILQYWQSDSIRSSAK